MTRLKMLFLMVLFSNVQAAKGLRIFIWGEYLKPELVKKFERQEKTKVSISYYTSNEDMLAKLQAGGVSQYDIIVPSDYIVPSLIALKLVQKLDHSKIPNLKNLSSKFKNPSFDPGNVYSAGYAWGTVGLLYNTKAFKHPIDSWSALFDPKEHVGKFLLMDSPRELIGPALKYLGKSLNSVNPSDLQAAGNLILTAKSSPMSLGFAADVGLKNRVLAGEAALSVVYSGDGMRAVRENKNLAYILPKEGGSLTLDSLCIPAKAPNALLAQRFINFILDPKNGAENAEWHGFATPNAAALSYTQADIRNNAAIYPPTQVLSRFEFIRDLGKNNRLYDEVWTALKSR